MGVNCSIHSAALGNITDRRYAEEWKRGILIHKESGVLAMLNREQLEAKKEIVYGYISSEDYKPLKFKEMAGILQVPRDEKEDLRQVLEELAMDGKICTDSKGKIRAVEGNLLQGIFCGTAKGYGFVRAEGMEEDIFVPENATNGALDKDEVQIQLEEGAAGGRRREGRVVRVLRTANDTIVGTYRKNGSYGFVISDNQRLGSDIFIPQGMSRGAVTGHKVVVKITRPGERSKNPEGKVTEILGHVNDPGVDILSIVRAYGLPEEYPDGVLRQVEQMPEEVSSEELAGRMDLREMKMVTIDGEDAKDLDDAVSLTKEGDVYHLGVHIADVSHYVPEFSPLDKEALKRGTSVYLVDRVIPMLPHKLSNGICSLNEGVDRLALSCMMDIDGKGNVVRHRIAETVVRVDRRMSYTSVKKILEDEDIQEIKKYEPLVPMFQLMLELAGILREKRRKRGSIDFDFPESKILLDAKGNPLDILPYERNKATKIIEDFMLIANETVAEDYFWQEAPFVYRTHENPDPEKILKLGIFINNFGYSIKIGQDEIHPKELQKLMEKIEDTPEEALISRLTLRSMKQAKYTVSNEGHFGLATRYYCHFTSPIRRYPDLQIHRIIKENLRAGLSEKRTQHYRNLLPEVAAQSSMMERRADEAEREVEKLKKVEYMKHFLGETFEGVISGITAWGVYVELPNTVEGMVRVTNLKDDYYFYDEEHYSMVGEHTHRTLSLGQKMKVRVEAADKILRTIDFVPAEDEDESGNEDAHGTSETAEEGR